MNKRILNSIFSLWPSWVRIPIIATLQWPHNGRDGVWNHRLNCWFRHKKHQSSASLDFVMGIHWWPVNSPQKRPAARKCFYLMTSSWHSSKGCGYASVVGTIGSDPAKMVSNFLNHIKSLKVNDKEYDAPKYRNRWQMPIALIDFLSTSK